MTHLKPKRWSALDLAEGLQLAHAVAALQKIGVLDAMSKPMTSEALSDTYNLDSELLRGVLEYTALRTDLIRKTRGKFAISAHYTAEARFLLTLYARAYSNNAVQLATLLKKPALAGAIVDPVEHAHAFEASDTSGGALASIIRQLCLNHVLDLGCGVGGMLTNLAMSDEEFVGWGIDRNPAMCRAARVQLRNSGIATRVRVFQGDGRDPGDVVPARVLALVRNVTASHFVNEMFRRGTSRVEAWLRHMRRMLPGRLLVISDYYGRLGHGIPTSHRATLLHDYVQLISGQGVPPPDSAAWLTIYQTAGCHPLHIIEDRNTTLFIHLIRL